MAQKLDVRTHLAHKRTELAHERTILAYFRTATALILFGVAFLGFQEKSPFYLYGGGTSMVVGSLFIIVAIHRMVHHQREIKKIETFFKMKLHHKKK